MTDAVVPTALVHDAMSKRAVSQSDSGGPDRFDASPRTARCTIVPSRSTWAATPAYRCSSIPCWRTSSGLVTPTTLVTPGFRGARAYEEPPGTRVTLMDSLP